MTMELSSALSSLKESNPRSGPLLQPARSSKPLRQTQSTFGGHVTRQAHVLPLRGDLRGLAYRQFGPQAQLLQSDNKSMLLIEVVAATMSFLISLTAGGFLLNWFLQRMVEATFAKTARIEAQDLDEKFRRFNGYYE